MQIQPEKEIILEYLNNEDYKYLRALAALYIRITGFPKEIYESLEPLYTSYAKLRLRNKTGSYSIIHMDEYIEILLWENEFQGIILPHIPKRSALEKEGQLEPRISILENEDDNYILDTLTNNSKSGGNLEKNQNEINQKEDLVDSNNKNLDNKKEDNQFSDEYWINLRKTLNLKPVELRKGNDQKDKLRIGEKNKQNEATQLKLGGKRIEPEKGEKPNDTENQTYSDEYWKNLRKKVGLSEIK